MALFLPGLPQILGLGVGQDGLIRFPTPALFNTVTCSGRPLPHPGLPEPPHRPIFPPPCVRLFVGRVCSAQYLLCHQDGSHDCAFSVCVCDRTSMALWQGWD